MTLADRYPSTPVENEPAPLRGPDPSDWFVTTLSNEIQSIERESDRMQERRAARCREPAGKRVVGLGWTATRTLSHPRGNHRTAGSGAAGSVFSRA
jgi:hypothetical protein